MGLITKQEIEACDARDRKPVKVPTPAWGKDGDKDPHVFVRQLSSKEVMALADKEADDDFMNAVKLVAASLCDKDKNPIADDGWRDLLAYGPHGPMQACLLEVNKLNGFGGDDKDDDSGN